MEASQYATIFEKIYPKLQTFVEKERGSETGGKLRTYLHKTMLRKVFSPDGKYATGSVDTTYVKADMVSFNSPLPIKSRPKVATASGKLPKHGMKKDLEESDLNDINYMKAQESEMWSQIAAKLVEDPIACSVGLDEENEHNFLSALSEGYVLVKDLNSDGNALRIDFGFLKKNGFGVNTAGELTLDDIEKVLDKATADGNTIVTIAIDDSTYKKLRQTRGAKELVANYNGQYYTDTTPLPVPTATRFDEAFADQYGGVTFLRINRSVYIEKNGVAVPSKPWNKNRLIYLTKNVVGSLVWGNLAEKTAPVNGVEYSTIDEYKLISSYRTTDPLRETTAGQMLALTVIEGVDSIYYQDISVIDDPSARLEGESENIIEAQSATASTSAKSSKKNTVTE